MMSPSTRRSSRAVAVATVLSTVLPSLPAAATQITLGWDPSPSQGVAGYRVFYGTRSGDYPSNVDAGASTSVTIGGLQTNQAYYFTVASYDASGNQSSLSSEVSVGSGASAGTGGTGGTGTTGGGAAGGAAPSAASGGGGGCASDPAQRPDISLAALVFAAAARFGLRRRRTGRPTR